MPIRAFKITNKEDLKLKLYEDIKKPVARPKREDIINAEMLTYNDKIIISYKAESNENMSLKELTIISNKFIIIFYFKKIRFNIF